MSVWRFVRYTIVWLALFVEASYSTPCDDAQNCLDDINKLPSTMSCLDKLDKMADLRKCVEDNVPDCDADKTSTITSGLTAAVSGFSTACSDGCSDVFKRYSNFTKCLLTDEALQQVLTSAVSLWNRNKVNVTVTIQLTEMVSCIEDSVHGCTLLRQAYGKLYEKFPQLPLIQQTLNIYKKVNGDDSSSPMIDDCDKDVDQAVSEIVSSCPINVSDTNGLIINYCVPMQEQIDCILRWQTTCPLAVTRVLRPFMDSYGITHRIFCNNITIHDLLLKSLNRECETETYQEIYRSCWKKIMKDFAINPQTNNDMIDSYSMDTFFKLLKFKNENLCGIFKDQNRYNIQELRSCTSSRKQECPLIFPTHGDPPPIPDGLRYDPDLYKQLLIGPTPFNEYGAILLQYYRDHFCYPDCDKYDEMNADYKENCEKKLKQLASEIENNQHEQCKSLSEDVTCARNVTIRCPLFQYQTSHLLEEESVKAALSVCNVNKPELLPDDYFLKTTTRQPLRTTNYWSGSTSHGTRTGDYYISSHPALITLLTATSLVYMLELANFHI